VKPVGPVEGILRAYLMDGNPPGGGPSWSMGMSFTDCISTQPGSVFSRKSCVVVLEPIAAWLSPTADVNLYISDVVVEGDLNMTI